VSARSIPYVVHQTWKTREIPERFQAWMASWLEHNPGAEHQLWSDERCREFVEREFPGRLAAYLSLATPVERADLWRYLVIYRHGGVYADLDAECTQSWQGLLGTQRGKLVVGLEAEVESEAEQRRLQLVRRRQYCNWVFAAPAGHPVLRSAIERVVANCGRQLGRGDPVLDVLERTGPGPWSDAVEGGDPARLAILPQVAFCSGHGGMPGSPPADPADPAIFSIHHYANTWRQGR
jgi:mannosyltransferase OCH1-like enzyme